ncbi:molybdopterin molybdotransferase MoeA [Polynucleobacter sp. HIN6]|uniref:molybdopterin molybdotransferase MoeA n=1 Tax=Polynucleobacter sp. HIN6 TaxID=3047865 RepID=UPI002572DFC4|nr:gephyrin-like molybdotransferase Glp [Polynucleobacter sp. HIN6]BEI34926.1 molybdopterin molybdotransferase MoeA [Polynucleobacter sp. HIN6]
METNKANQEFQSDFLSVTDARQAIADLIASSYESSGMHLKKEILPLHQCLGRILAGDILSPIDVPAHDNSAMDGYAFNSGELRDDRQNLELTIIGTLHAGQTEMLTVKPGQCIKIMTGALMPATCDTVVPQEFTKTLSNGLVSFSSSIVRAGENRRLRGEDLQSGKAAILQGRILRPADLGLAASLGIHQLEVYQRTKVAILSSGNELCDIHESLAPGKIFDSNRYSLRACIERLGMEVIDYGIVRDNPDDLRRAFIAAAQTADVIISSGGVSVGEADFTKQMMEELGEVGFWKIAMRPGRPMAFGSLKPSSSKPTPTVFFGLPGNPVAVMVTFYQFVRNALLQLNGAKWVEIPLIPVRSAAGIRKKSGRTEFQRGILFQDDQGQWVVKTTGSQGAGILRSMSEANCFIILHHDQGNIAPGDWVDVEIFDGLL